MVPARATPTPDLRYGASARFASVPAGGLGLSAPLSSPSAMTREVCSRDQQPVQARPDAFRPFSNAANDDTTPGIKNRKPWSIRPSTFLAST